MEMTNEEIRRDYAAAKDKKKQIKILAQLNDCDPMQIVDIVANPPKVPKNKLFIGKDLVDKVVDAFKKGATVKEVTETFNIPRSKANSIKREAGLVKPRETKKTKPKPVAKIKPIKEVFKKSKTVLNPKVKAEDFIPADATDIIKLCDKRIVELEERLSDLKTARQYFLNAFKEK